ncbi:transposase [Tateyamaria pelophila]|uniref:transposase n=1 Tax=Tateyamaria pelophila TaxID=328415 RepID=UPI001CBA8518|nr:transposase [Tateyamaria pelophila]
MCPAYIAGLIGPADRKCVQPMAACDPTTSYDRLHYFIASEAWETALLEAAVLAEAGYGACGAFRQTPIQRGLDWAVGMSHRQNVHPADTGLLFPEATRGRRRKYHISDRVAVSVEVMLVAAKWQKISWRRGTKGKLSCQFASRLPCADRRWSQASHG